MTSPEQMALLLPCDILVELDHGAFGLAAWLFNQPVQHALMVSQDTSKAWEGTYNGVHCNPISLEKPYMVYRINGLTDEQRTKILARAKTDEGKPYGYLELLEIGIQLKTGLDLDFLGADDAPLVCSGWITRWTRPDADLTPGKETHEVTPQDLQLSKMVSFVTKLPGIDNAAKA